MRSKVYICYRRTMTSTAVATLLRKQVEERFGSKAVFQDVVNISPGDSFPEKLGGELASTKFMLAVFEDDWLTVSDRHGQRLLDSETDWVRRELAYSLSEPEVTVIPILIGATADLPKQQNASVLPAELQPLLQLHRVRVNDTSMERDMVPIIDRLEGDLISVDSQGSISVTADAPTGVAAETSTKTETSIDAESAVSSQVHATTTADGWSAADRLADFFYSRQNVMGMAGVALALVVGLIWPVSAMRLVLTTALFYAAGLLAASIFPEPEVTQPDNLE